MEESAAARPELSFDIISVESAADTTCAIIAGQHIRKLLIARSAINFLIK